MLDKQLTLGQLVSAELIVSGVLLNFSKVGKQLESLYDMLAGFDKVGHLLDLPQEAAGTSAFLERHAGPAGVTVKSVSYAHAGRDRLRDASLVVHPGERVALTGANGSGKSTLLSMLYGLLVPVGGTVEVDGEPVHTVASRLLRAEVALVRGIEIFAGTILENVVAGRADVSNDDVRAALENMDLWNDVKALPQGIDSQVTTYGSGLSMSDARKLVLARATVGKPRLLLLDDALDALDPPTRERVAGYLFAPDRAWTIVCATQDPAILRHCTRTVVLAHGRTEVDS